MLKECYHVRNKYIPADLIRFSIVHIETAKKVWLTEHHHTEIEIGLYLAGSGTYMAGGTEQSFAAGDILLFGSNQEHIIKYISCEKDIILVNLHIDPRLLWDSSVQSFSQGILRSFSAGLTQKSYKIMPSQKNYTQIRDLLQHIEEEFREQQAEFEIAVEAKLLDIFVNIVRSAEYIPPSQINHDISREHLSYLEKATGYILNNLSEDLTLDTLAKQSNISRSYLCSLFKEVNGVSIWEYITIKRIELAIGYLRDTNQSITCVGGLCGFNTTANFNRAFKKITQQSPSEFRKNSRHYY